MATRKMSNGNGMHGLMGKRKHTGPPLYDLIVSRHGGGGQRVAAQETGDFVDAGEGGRLSLLNPGRKVAFPAGYLFLAAAVAMGLVVAAFMFGHQRGETHAKASFDQALLEASRQADEARQTDDPLMASVTDRYDAVVARPNGGERPAEAEAGARSNGSLQRRQSNGSDGRSISERPGPIESDPRVEGAYYYVLVTTRRDGAKRLANFCRQRGLEAYVVGGHNGGLSQVIVLPALETRSNSDPMVRRLREQILKIGRVWETSEPGATDLSDAYVQLHTD